VISAFSRRLPAAASFDELILVMQMGSSVAF
jgi:hypothetical protein